MSIQFVTFTLGEHLLGLPVENVQEVIGAQPVTPVPRSAPCVAGLMNLRGQVVTAIDLRAQFRMAARADGPGTNVLARTATGPVALVVDRIGDVIVVSGDQFEPPPATLNGPARSLIIGSYTLPDGLLLHLNLDAALDVTT